MSIEGRQLFADLINRLVNEVGSRRAFARKIGVTSSAVSGWQERKSIPDLENLTTIASCSGYSIQELQNMLIGKTAVNQVGEITQIKNKIQTMKVHDLTQVYRLVSDRLVAIAESAGSVGMDLNDFDQHSDIFDIKTYLPLPPKSSNKGTHIKADFLNGKTTILPYELRSKIREALSKGGLDHLWIKDSHGYALPCRILQDGKGWQNGKIVVSVSFIPDPPEEAEKIDELDGLRQL